MSLDSLIHPSKFTGYEESLTCYYDSLCKFKYEYMRQNQLYNNIYCEVIELVIIQGANLEYFELDKTQYFATLDLNVT